MLSSIDRTLLVSRLFLVFSDNKLNLFDVVIRLDNDDLIFDELFLGRIKELVLLCSLRLISSVLQSRVFWIFFGFRVTFEWWFYFLLADILFHHRYFISSHTNKSVDFFFFFAIVLITNNCSIIKDLKTAISLFNADILLHLFYLAPIFIFYWWCFIVYWRWKWFIHSTA